MFADLFPTMDRDMLDSLGGPVIYQPELGAAVTVTGIFDAPYVLAQGVGETGVEAARPRVFLLLVDLPIDPELDDPTITIGEVDYHVFERQPDGVGGIVLVLSTVA